MTLSLSKTRLHFGFLPVLVARFLTLGELSAQTCPNLGNLTNYLFVFTNGSTDANWQGATKGFAGDVAIDGIQAAERTSGNVPFAGTIYTNGGSLGAWAGIVSQNSGQAFASTGQASRMAGLEADLASAFSQINAMLPSPGYSGVSSTSLNGLNTQNGVAQTFVINITSGMQVSTQINITGDASDCFVLRWDSDGNPNNGYQGQTKFQSGGAIVPLGGLKPSNFINLAGDINSSGGGSNPPAPYPQGPRTNSGTGSLIGGASNFGGGGFFTGYWLTTGDPATGESSSMSNGIFVGGWYTSATKFSMTSGTSGVYVAPNAPPPTNCTPPAPRPECTPPTTFDLNVVANGDVTWSSLGLGDNQNITQRIRISGTGTVRVPNGNVKLEGSGAVLFIDGPTFVVQNGNLELTNAGARYLQVGGKLQTYGNFQQTGNTVICITGCAIEIGEELAGTNFVPGATYTSANWQNDGGYRYLKDNCINVTHDFQLQSSGSGTGLNGVDVIINCCIEIGDQGGTHATPSSFGFADGQDSGNWQNNNRQSIYGTDIVVANGSFQNSINVLTLCDVGIKVNKSGNLQVNSGSVVGQNVCVAVEDHFENSGSWSASIQNWYSQKQNSTNVPGAGAEASLNTVLQCFVNCCQLGLPGSLGDCVWNDQNQNGIKDNGESGVPNVTVQLLNCQNTVLQTTFTNAAGFYNFPNLGAGCYRVCVVLPTGFQFSPQNQGGNDANDSDVATTDGKTTNIDLSPGENDPTNDAGIFQPTPQLGSLGDCVWNDQNQNGIKDNGEPGVPNVTVQLLNCQNAVLQTTFTNAAGFYNFPNLGAGCYRVCVILPTGFQFSPQNQGGNDANDSDVATTDGKTANIDLSPGENDPTNDAGIFQPAPPCNINILISNKICDGKGTATTADDTYTFTMTVTGTGTGATWQGSYNNAFLGVFQFGPTPYNTPINLGPFPAGQFTSSNTNPPIILQNGLDINISVSDTQKPNCSDNETVISTGPCSPTANPCDNVTITATPGAITVTGLNGAPIVMVQVFNAAWQQVFNCAGNCTVPTQVIPSLPAGNYYIKVSLLTAQWAAICQKELYITVSGGQVGSLGDCVWNDQNQNGIKDPTEPGVPNVMVQLKNCTDQILQTAQTNASGIYNFPNLAAGCYRVCFVLPTGFQFSPQNQGGNDANDSDADANGCTANIDLSPGENDPTNDAGIFQPTTIIGSVGDCVWNDLNQNGIKDNGEPGVSGVRVRLYTCAGVQLQEKFTNGSGFYLFPNIAAGNYYVGFDLLPAGFQFTVKDAGGNDATDSDPNPANGQTDCFPLAPGENKTTVDAGIKQSVGTKASLGDYVWLDINANGCQDLGEMGIENVWVGLYDNAGNFLQQDFTDAMGLYLFENLLPGTYKVKITPPAGLRNSPRNTCSGDDTKDSDVDDVTFTNFSDAVSLVAGQNYRDLDAGFVSIPSPCITPISASISAVTCANGQVTFSLLVTGGNPWGWNINNGGQIIMGTYGIAKTVTLPISGNSLSLIISDSDNPTCVANSTVNCSNQPPTGTDLELTANASPQNPGQWANSVLTFSLKNNGTVAATGVEVQLPAMSDAAFNSVLAYVSQNVPGGTTFNSWTGKWTVGNLAAGQTLNLGYTLFTKSAGPIPVFAQVSAQNPTDSDSSPNNNATGTPTEDDEVKITLNAGGNLLKPGDRKDAKVIDPSKIADFALFPNPAGETVTIDMEKWQGKSVNVLILNHLGKVVFQKQIDRQETPLLTLDLSGWQNGQYFVQLQTAGQRKVVKKLAVVRMY